MKAVPPRRARGRHRPGRVRHGWGLPGRCGAATVIASGGPFDSAADATRIERQQWKLLLRNLPMAFISNALVCAIMGVAVWLHVDSLTPLVWLAVALAAQGLRYIVWRQYKRKAVIGPGLNRARLLILATTALGGLVWGLGLPLILPDADSAVTTFAGIVVTGLNAGAMASSLPVRASFLGFILCLNVPMAVYYASLGGTLNTLLVVALAGFTGIMVGVARNIDRQSRENVGMRLAQARMIRDLRAAHDALARSDQAKTQFLATMSHELRTPLNIVLGFAKSIEDESLGPHAARGYVDYAATIRDSGEHLLALINDVLDLSKVGAGQYQIHPDWLDLGDLARGVVRALGEMAASRRVKLGLEREPDLPPVWGDPRALRQVLINLVTNALKFTGEGGEVRVTLAADSRAVTVTVADTGVGIPEKDLEKVLEPFVQSDSQPTRHYEGTGLGLALSKQLTELHGGELHLDSTVGEGTTVTVVLPRVPAEDAPPPPGYEVSRPPSPAEA